MSAHIASLQQQVDDLFQNLNALRSHVDMQHHSLHHAPEYSLPAALPSLTPRLRTKSTAKHPRFHGPTSSAFNLGVARSSLKTMGITAAEDAEDEDIVANECTPQLSPPVPSTVLTKSPMHVDKDPIWSISKHEALRLVHAWHDEQGIMYPVVDMAKMLQHTEMLFSFVEAASRSGFMQGTRPGADAIMDEQTTMLKIILATALVQEGTGYDALGERLFENAHAAVMRTLTDPVNLHGINLLVLTVSRAYAPFFESPPHTSRACIISPWTTKHCPGE